MSDRQELGWRQYRKMRADLLADTDTCMVCGHDGSQAVDHITPVKRGGAKLDPANLAPIHGVDGCPTCGRKCNNIKGDKLLEEMPQLLTSRDWYAPSS